MYSAALAGSSLMGRPDLEVKVGFKGEYILNYDVYQFEVVEVNTNDITPLATRRQQPQEELLRTLYPHRIRISILNVSRPPGSEEEANAEEASDSTVREEWVHIDLLHKMISTGRGFETVFTIGHQETHNPYGRASCCSKMFFIWVNRIISIGTKRTILKTDIPQSIASDHAASVTSKLQDAWDEQLKLTRSGRQTKPSLYRAIVKSFGWEIFRVWPILLIEELASIANSVVLIFLLCEFSGCNDADPLANVTNATANGTTIAGDSMTASFSAPAEFLAVLLVVLTAIVGLAHHEYFFSGWRMGLHLRSACTGVIFNKSLRLSVSAFHEATNGHIVNIASSDVERFYQMSLFAHAIWSVPFLITIVVGCMAYLIGWFALLCLPLLVVLILAQMFIGRAFGRLRAQTAKLTDRRVKRTGQMIAANRIMKMYAWEKPFRDQIHSSRRQESRSVKKATMLRGVNQGTQEVIPLITAFVIFSVYYRYGDPDAESAPLTAQIVFPTLGFLYLASRYLGFLLPIFIQTFAETKIALQRMEKFLLLPEHDASTKRSERLSGREMRRLLNKSYRFNEGDTDFHAREAKTRSEAASQLSAETLNLVRDYVAQTRHRHANGTEGTDGSPPTTNDDDNTLEKAIYSATNGYIVDTSTTNYMASPSPSPKSRSPSFRTPKPEGFDAALNPYMQSSNGDDLLDLPHLQDDATSSTANNLEQSREPPIRTFTCLDDVYDWLRGGAQTGPSTDADIKSAELTMTGFDEISSRGWTVVREFGSTTAGDTSNSNFSGSNFVVILAAGLLQDGEPDHEVELKFKTVPASCIGSPDGISVGDEGTGNNDVVPLEIQHLWKTLASDTQNKGSIHAFLEVRGSLQSLLGVEHASSLASVVYGLCVDDTKAGLRRASNADEVAGVQQKLALIEHELSDAQQLGFVDEVASLRARRDELRAEIEGHAARDPSSSNFVLFATLVDTSRFDASSSASSDTTKPLALPARGLRPPRAAASESKLVLDFSDQTSADAHEDAHGFTVLSVKRMWCSWNFKETASITRARTSGLNASASTRESNTATAAAPDPSEAKTPKSATIRQLAQQGGGGSRGFSRSSSRFGAGGRSSTLTQSLATKKSAPSLSLADPSQEVQKTVRGCVLRDIDFDATTSSVTGVMGPVGSGKSTLLMALLKEISPESGFVTFNQPRGSHTDAGAMKIAYVAQQPWITSATVRDNILFGHPFEKSWYQTVTAACALLSDFGQFSHGDQTMIGERGVNLSGGQRARVALARAVYSKSQVYLLDDPLSAVDTKVAAHLFYRCIKGVLRDTLRATVILVTHQLQFARGMDGVVILDDTGRQVAPCKPAEELKDEMSALKHRDHVQPADSASGAVTVEGKPRSSSTEDEELMKKEMEVLDQTPQSQTQSYESVVKSRLLRSVRTLSGGANKSLIQDEESAVGSVSFQVCCRCLGLRAPQAVISFILMVATTTTVVLHGWWLAEWTEDEDQDGRLPIWAVIVGCGIILLYARAFTFMGMLVDIANKLHDMALLRVVRAPMLFFDSNPIGRILNRFAKDLSIMDDMLPQTSMDFFSISSSVLGSIVLVCVVNPYVLIVLFPVGIGFFLLRREYMAAAREIKRIESVARSPIFRLLSEALTGLVTIRGYGSTRLFEKHMILVNDDFIRANFWNLATARWFGWRLDFLAWIFLAATSLGAVAVLGQLDSATVSLVGLSLSLTLQMSSSFQWAVRQSAELENMMISTERLLQYTELPQEPPLLLDRDPLALRRPLQSHCCKPRPRSRAQSIEELERRQDYAEFSIVLDDLCVRYRPELDLVLRHVNARIRRGEKIGVVGRTGSGKSSLVLALFRLVEADRPASIFINGVPSSAMGLHDLRNKISIIPQEPVMFEGSVRSNLDPFGEYDDHIIWNAVRAASLGPRVETLDGQLDAVVEEGGTNFSMGQRQLFCLARAILKDNEILVLDEATSNVDVATDRVIQKVIRAKFSSRTVVTIAHRLNTIIDCDRIMVLEKGQIEELDTPYHLLKNHFEPSKNNVLDGDTESVKLSSAHGFATLVAETGQATAEGLWQQVRRQHETDTRSEGKTQ